MNILNRYSDIFINNKTSNCRDSPDIINYSNTESITNNTSDSTTNSSSDDSISYCNYKNNVMGNIFIKKPEDNIKILIRYTVENIMIDIVQDIIDNSLDDIINDIMSDHHNSEDILDSSEIKYKEDMITNIELNESTSTDEISFNKNKVKNNNKLEGCFKKLCNIILCKKD